METVLQFKSSAEEAAHYKAEIDKLFRAMERSEKRRLKIRAERERLRAETQTILKRIESK